MNILSHYRVRDVIGYDPEILLDDRIDIMDFLHPSDQSILMKTRGQCKHCYVAVYLPQIYPSMTVIKLIVPPRMSYDLNTVYITVT